MHSVLEILKKGDSVMRKLSGIQAVQSSYMNNSVVAAGNVSSLAAMSGLFVLPLIQLYPIQPFSLHIAT